MSYSAKPELNKEDLYSIIDDTVRKNDLLIIYSDYVKYKEMFDVSNYFNVVTDVKIQCVDRESIKNVIDPTLMREIMNYSPKKIKFNGLSLSPTLKNKSHTFNDTAKVTIQNCMVGAQKSHVMNREDIILTFSATELDTLETKDVKDMCQQLSRQTEEFNKDKDTLSSNHSKMYSYMKQINTTISAMKYNTAKNVLANFANVNKIDSYIIRACEVFGTMSQEDVFKTVEKLSSAIELIFVTLLKKQYTDKKYVNIRLKKLLQDFGFNSNSFTTVGYYNIRDCLIRALSCKRGGQSSSSCGFFDKNNNSEDSEASVQYFIDLLKVEVFLKTCYPLIQFKFIDSLMKFYMQAGDFVQTRLALFSKVFFTLYLSSILSIAHDQVKGPKDIQLKIDNILSLLNDYIARMNNLKIEDKDAKSADVLTAYQDELSSSSKSVQYTARKNEDLQEDIHKVKLNLRNVSTNVEMLRSKEGGYKIEYIISVTLLITVLLTCTTLIILGNIMGEKKEFFYKIVTYITVILISLIIFYKVTLTIISWISSPKQ